jgi:hypothetical protein
LPLRVAYLLERLHCIYAEVIYKYIDGWKPANGLVRGLGLTEVGGKGFEFRLRMDSANSRNRIGHALFCSPVYNDPYAFRRKRLCDSKTNTRG